MKKTQSEDLKKESQRMKDLSEKTKLSRSERHFSKTEATRVAGFQKALGHKKQIKRDYDSKEENQE